MKNKNLIWIGVGVVLAYFIFRPKKAAAQDKQDMKNFMYATGKQRKKKAQQSQDPLVPPIYYARRK